MKSVLLPNRRNHVENQTSSILAAVTFSALLLTSLILPGCSKSERKIVEALPAYQPSPSPPPPELPNLPAQLTEVHAVIKRVFKDAAYLDKNRDLNFIVGDFNGDRSQDIAVVIKPTAEQIEEMNQEFPPWILKDPFVSSRPGNSPSPIDENETLLAVIHGNGPNAWRDPEATQTYLLKNAVGSNIKTHSRKEFLAANAGKRLPQLHGDLIGEVLRGTSGYLYYSGATYSWYDPATYRGEPELRLVHGGNGVKGKN
jgi:hypothetical protein